VLTWGNCGPHSLALFCLSDLIDLSYAALFDSSKPPYSPAVEWSNTCHPASSTCSIIHSQIQMSLGSIVLYPSFSWTHMWTFIYVYTFPPMSQYSSGKTKQIIEQPAPKNRELNAIAQGHSSHMSKARSVAPSRIWSKVSFLAPWCILGLTKQIRPPPLSSTGSPVARNSTYKMTRTYPMCLILMHPMAHLSRLPRALIPI